MGVILREAGLPSQAVQEFQHILRVHSHMLDSQVQLGLTYYSMGRTPEAIAEWDAVLERDPSRDDARMYLRLVRGVNRRLTRPTIDPVVSARNAVEDDLEVSRWTTSILTTAEGESTK